MHGLTHLHKRKRSRVRANFWVRILDGATLTAGIIGPLTDIPQILKILATHNATGVSLIAWCGAALLDIPFILYGLAHKDRPIATTYSLWLIGNVCIAILTAIYS